MPKFNLANADVKALVIFLKSRHGINFRRNLARPVPARLNEVKVNITPEGKPEVSGATPAARGKQLIEDRACTACHKLGDRGRRHRAGPQL